MLVDAKSIHGGCIISNLDIVMLAVPPKKGRIAKGSLAPSAMRANGSITSLTDSVNIHIRK